MATGDQADFVTRLRQLLPDNWFPAAPAAGEQEKAPVLVGVLSGCANVLAWLWLQLADVSNQARLQTTTGTDLSMKADDYFGIDNFPRMSGETDAAYRQRIINQLRATKNTRAAIIAAVQAVTGTTPTIIEQTNADDCKGYGSTANPSAGGGYGYGAGLHNGHLSGGQFFITVQRGSVTDDSIILNAINSTKAVGAIAWTRITD
ncbi:hypothetical protein [Acetobacter aceti]|uniref:Uncharacterized protein n=1 Tax=Acetobacter aceti TaxID=435 RepID=A0A6S6PMZ4_ACEAC|nr:hypothetical protein [Acetobacter aceti]BCI68061.1 hypothetical protein AAJCM20276_26850 [Acetobacter aceti]